MGSTSVILSKVFRENGSLEIMFGSGHLLSDLSANIMQTPSHQVLELPWYSWLWSIIFPELLWLGIRYQAM